MKTNKVIQAYESVDRGHYCTRNPYVDSPQGIGYGATISAPHMHAMALELMADKLAQQGPTHALDIGSGSGALTVCMALLLSSNGRVVGIDHFQELVDQSIHNINQDGHGSLLDRGALVIKQGDGRIGCPEYAPYDVIHVGAAITDPNIKQTLIDQLKPNGILVTPFGSSFIQSFLIINKDDHGHIHERSVCDVQYIPLTSRNEQLY